MEGTSTLQERRDALASASAGLVAIDHVLHQAPSDQLGPLMSELDEQTCRIEAAKAMVLAEAVERGEPSGSLAGSDVGWVRHWAPSLRAVGGAGQLVGVVRAFAKPANAPLKEAVTEARLPIRSAAAVSTEIERLRGRIVPEADEPVLRGLIMVAAEHGPTGARMLRQRMLADFGVPGELQAEQDKARRLVSLSQPYPSGDGAHDYRLCLDDESRAVLEAALGPLSAPRPAEGCSDLRTSDQRRGEALIELCRRGVSAPGEVPTTAKAQLFLLMDYDKLAAGVGAACTIGGAGAGTLLAPDTVRQIACDAELVPAVLGSRGEVLDMGRRHRLFTSAQLRALWIRDGVCTFPECDMPGQWDDGHHLWHWIDGGPTDLGNAALLCGRHHTVVHQRRLMGYVTPEGVEWDLRRGSYDTFLTEHSLAAQPWLAANGSPPAREVWAPDGPTDNPAGLSNDRGPTDGANPPRT